jgi:hypothetical protein
MRRLRPRAVLASRRWRAVTLLAAVALALPLIAQADPVDTYIAGVSPATVQPSLRRPYVITLTNSGDSPDSARAASIAIPAGFAVDPATLTATTTASGACVSASWTPALAPDNSHIDLTSPPGAANALCPGAVLTINFVATASAAEGTYVWQTQLSRGDTPFTLNGSQPTVIVDGSPPPPPAIADAPSGATTATSARFVFSDSEDGLSFQCRLDGGAFAPCESPKAYTGLANGPHTFTVRAIDAAGNTGAAATRSWTVDTVPPDTAVSSGPGAVSGSPSATFTFGSTEGGSTFVCSIDGRAYAPCVSPQTYGGFGNGAHSFRVRATDAAGNVDPTPASYAWTVALLGPSRVDRTPPGNVAGLARRVGYKTLKLRWRKPSDADFHHVRVLVTNDARRAPRVLVYNGARTSYTDAKFRNGVYYRYAIISYDRAGNASKGVRVVVRPGALLVIPKEGARLRPASLLDWVAVRGATFYNVQLYYGSTKVLSAWPRLSKLKLKKRWSYRGRSYTLKKGRYRWYVWPGFGGQASIQYGQLLGESTFIVR